MLSSSSLLSLSLISLLIIIIIIVLVIAFVAAAATLVGIVVVVVVFLEADALPRRQRDDWTGRRSRRRRHVVNYSSVDMSCFMHKVPDLIDYFAVELSGFGDNCSCSENVLLIKTGFVTCTVGMGGGGGGGGRERK